MNEIFLNILLSISTLLGVNSIPNLLNNWNVTHTWHELNGVNRFEASSIEIIKECQKDPNLIIKLPQVIHGVHELILDSNIIFQSGDIKFRSASSFYEHPTLNCNLITNGKELTWKIYSYSKYFSRFNYFPKVAKQNNLGLIFDVNFNIIAFGALLLLSIISFYLFYSRVDKDLLRSIILGAIFFAMYFLMCVSSSFDLKISMLNAHKIADISLMFGLYFYFRTFKLFGFLTSFELIFYTIPTLINCSIIFFGTTGDIIQFGTSINLPFVMISLIQIFFASVNNILKDKNNRVAWLSSFSIIIFVITSSSDILHIFGITTTYMIAPIGVIFCFFLIVLSANEQIEMTYKERDSLLATLENKVNEKTKDLNEALENLKNSQAELVQSAKLASLGTLSAGIAHEINNSINFVNGAIVPLERKVIKHIPEDEKDSIGKLFTVIKQGTDLTVQIVRSLRNFTGLNQSSFREVNVEEITNSVLTILRSKLNGIKLNLNIEKNLTFEGSQVGISQAIMNLLANSIDALPKENPEISISAKSDSEFVEISISDNGSGIPDSVKERIFDPFYTTKEVGKGTGLGLFIVKKEIDKHKGTILVKSEPQKGSTFILKLLKKNKVLETSVNLEAA